MFETFSPWTQGTALLDPCRHRASGTGVLAHRRVPGRIDAQPLSNDEISAWTNDVAAAIAATLLSQIADPNASCASGRLGSLVERLHAAADAVEAGDFAAAKALLTSVRKRIDGVKKPEDWLLPSAAQADLLEQVDALLLLVG